MTTTIQKIFEILELNKWTVSTAESCTGGLIGAAFTDIAGSSNYYYGGVIAYDNSIKKALIDVPSETLDKYGAVSNQTALAMVNGVRNRTGTDCAISTTGIAGPGGGTEIKPVGLVYIGITVRDNVKTFKFEFNGSREEIRRQTVAKALECLLETLSAQM
ncbi:MAG: CinA family protein [Chitinispirillaceae bacterium]|nr:CinA family protein [Chitinispirillaceae bacterium]